MSDEESGPISPSYMRTPSSMPSTPKSPQYAPSDHDSDEYSGIEWSIERKKIEEEKKKLAVKD